MKIKILLVGFCLLQFQLCKCQDTFSIVALDSITRQVGSAGASCLDLFWAGYSDPTFLTDLIPDTGAVNTQSYYIQANQDNARIRMRAGDTPAQIIAWLVANDQVNNPEFKQYGIVGFNGNNPSAAAHTGNACLDYKNHITGSMNGMYYSIQGNILKGQMILDSMEARFRNTHGDLACRLMAAMQGAKVIGADSRCNTKNTSSLFAFLQVANPTDVHKQPSLNISLRTKDGEGIEPIDSLQQLFDKVENCAPLSISSNSATKLVRVFPNPTNGNLYVHCANFDHAEIIIYNIWGQQLIKKRLSSAVQLIDITNLLTGMYSYLITKNGDTFYRGKIQIQ